MNHPNDAIALQYWTLVNEHGRENVEICMSGRVDLWHIPGPVVFYDEFTYEVRLKPRPPKRHRLGVVDYPAPVNGGSWSVGINTTWWGEHGDSAVEFKHLHFATQSDAEQFIAAITSGKEVQS